MNANTDTAPKPPRLGGLTKLRMIQFAVGGVIGGLAGVFVGRALKKGVLDAAAWTWADHMALILGGLMLVLGVGIGLMSLSGAPMDRTLDPSGRRRATPAQRTYYRLQAAVLGLAGIMMLIPPLWLGLYGPPAPTLAGSLMAGIAALFLLQTAFNIAVWQRSDELVRGMVAESGAISFWTLQGALFLWAAAERLGLAPAATAWELMVVMMAAYLAVSSLVSLRRGFA